MGISGLILKVKKKKLMSIEPGYLALYRSGELERRAIALEARLAACNICPRECGAERLKGKIGRCQTGALAVVSSVCAHHGEEPALSGTRGSGTIFFGNCNMRCVYSQNYQISPVAGSAKRERGEKCVSSRKKCFISRTSWVVITSIWSHRATSCRRLSARYSRR